MVPYLKDQVLRLLPRFSLLSMVLNGLHPNIEFTVELLISNEIPFIGIEIVKRGTKLESQNYRKPTNTGLHNQIKDTTVKDFLLKTVLHVAYALASNLECDKIALYFPSLSLSQGSHRFHH